LQGKRGRKGKKKGYSSERGKHTRIRQQASPLGRAEITRREKGGGRGERRGEQGKKRGWGGEGIIMEERDGGKEVIPQKIDSPRKRRGGGKGREKDR